jgi:hypothetical protein
MKYKIYPAVDGGWSSWSQWSSCDVTCGNGLLLRQRTCNNPTPQNGGLDCPGHKIEKKSCSLQLCPGKFIEMKIFFILKNILKEMYYYYLQVV